MSDHLAVLPQYLMPKQALTVLAGRFASARLGSITTAPEERRQRVQPCRVVGVLRERFAQCLCCPGRVALQRRPAGCCGEAKEMVARQGNAPCSTD